MEKNDELLEKFDLFKLSFNEMKNINGGAYSYLVKSDTGPLRIVVNDDCTYDVYRFLPGDGPEAVI